MARNFLALFFSLLALLNINLSANPTQATAIPYILVSVAPDKFFVEKISGDTVKVELMVPAGASSHTFEPTPKQMLNASHADIWFQIGESFETRASRALQGHNPKLTLIDLRKGVDLIIDEEGGGCHCSAHAKECCVDPHFWLSARQAKIQARTIADALTQRYPQHAQLYAKNLHSFIQELEELNKEIEAKLAPLQNRTIMVSHPAYAYFCRDYALKQLSIEFEGKDPSPRQLTNVLTRARHAGIKTVFIQMQYNNKGALLIAKELGAKVVTLDPYAEDYFTMMREVASHFAAQ
ncbi:MAG: zinc ABC transporter substrate-binding protein [Parachlamydiaceae bacterium]|nr:zinc ABC transporter substrate-binding protein [Parachlamydiaceae bacterium]